MKYLAIAIILTLTLPLSAQAAKRLQLKRLQETHQCIRCNLRNADLQGLHCASLTSRGQI
jgi:hypothetical protein